MKSKMLIFIFLSLILSLFAFEWENPILVDQTHEIKNYTATVQMPTGYVSVWIDNRSGNDQLFAQYIDNDLNKRWAPDGLLISDQVSLNNLNVYRSDNHSVLMQWEYSTTEDNENVEYSICLKRIDLWGNTIWEYESTYQGLIPKLVQDDMGGVYVCSGEQIDQIRYINSQGDVSQPFSNNTTVFSDLKVTESNDCYLIAHKNYCEFLQKYNSNHQLEWEIDYPYTNNSDTFIYLMPDQSVVYATTSNASFKLYKYNEQGQSLWGSNGVQFNNFFEISLYRLQHVGDDLIITFKSNGKLLVNKVNAEGALSWSRNIGDFIDNYDYDLFVLSDQSMLVTWKNYLIYTQLNKDKTSFLQRIDINGNLLLNTPLGFEYSSKDESYQNVFIHENSLLRFNVEMNGQFFKTNLTQFNESTGHLGTSSSVIYTANSADLRIMKVIENNNNVLVIYQRENYSYYRNVLCKLYDQQGHLITENEIFLDYSIYYQRFLDVYTDQYGDFYVIWRTNITNFNGLSQYAYFSDDEARNEALGTKIQKIDGNTGQILYPQNGMLICGNDFNCTTVFKDNAIFFYMTQWDYLNRIIQVYSQKMINDQMLYDGIGQLIFNEPSDAYMEIFVANREENVLELVFRNHKSISKLLKINNEGIVDESWQSSILARGLNTNTNRLLIKLTDKYLYCYRNDKINCMFLDLNGNIISNQELIQNNVSMISYLIKWNDRLDVFVFNHPEKKKYSFAFNDGVLVALESNPVNLNYEYFNFDNIFYHNDDICIVTSDLTTTGFDFYLNSLDENGNETARPALISRFENPYLYNKNFVLDNSSIYGTFENYNLIHIQKLFAQTSSNSEFSETVKPGIDLLQNYPNPFNPSTKIAFTLKAEEDIELNIYNIKGQKVKHLFKGKQDAGRHEVIWNGRDTHDHEVSAGVYFYQLKGKNQNLTRKMLMIK